MRWKRLFAPKIQAILLNGEFSVHYSMQIREYCSYISMYRIHVQFYVQLLSFRLQKARRPG